MTARNEVAAVPTAALDARTIPRLLARVAGVDPEGAETLSWSAEVLKHRTDRRWLIRYTVRSPDGPAARPRVFVGKLYVKPSKAARAFRLTRSLRSDVFADAFPLCIPAPMLLEPKLGLVLQEFVGGADLRAALSTEDAEPPLALAARWLARLHSAAPLPGLPVKSLAYELAKVDGWCDEISPQLTGPEAVELRRAQAALRALATHLPEPRLAMIHRDFYYANVLWDGTRIWVVDFDPLALGDPAQDVGHFLANLEDLARRTAGWDRIARAGETFVAAYRAASGVDPRESTRVYRATTFLKLAAKAVERRTGERWLASATSLVRLACALAGA